MFRTFRSVFRNNFLPSTKRISADRINSYFFCRRFQFSSTMILNVAEKNDAAKNLAEIMSRGSYRRRDGLSQYNKIYEFEYRLFNQNCTMIMTSVSGHLLNLDFVGSYRKWHGCNPINLFDAPVVMECENDYVKIKKTLEREVRNCNKLIIWTDGDREGENIGFEIIEVCRNVKPHIQVFRARFSEITPQAISRACQNLGEPNKNISDAVNVRRELDLRIGAAFTRFQTLRLKKVFPESLQNQLISYGSCQFPTLGFVVERYKQVQSFIAEPFWKIKVTHLKNGTQADFTWKRGRLFDHTACLVIYQICLENPTAHVTDLKTKPKSKWRPLPLDTVELEKLASRKLRMNAKETMHIAERLYTQGYISYPRTETNKFPKDINLGSLVEMQVQDPNWGGFASRVLNDGPNPRQGNKTDNAHPPIHPTKYAKNLQGNEARLYEFIVRHFLASLSKDAEGQETIAEIDINGEKFGLNGLIIIAKNYLEVYPYDKWNSKIIPEYALGETFQPSSIEMVDGETSPPPLLTEADLIALMEKHGIGTDATHADHIETIKSRLYVGLNEDKFVPGQLGMGLVEGYDNMGFEMSKPHLRAELEADLKRICEGTKDPNVVLREQLNKYQQVFIQAVRQAIKIDEALSKYLDEQQCQISEGECYTNFIILNFKKFYLSCMSYPQCNAVIWLPNYVENVSVDNSLCEECQIRKLKFKFEKGSLAPLYPDNYIGCIGGCDENFLQALSIRRIMPNSAYFSALNTGRNISMASNVSSNDSGFNQTSILPASQTSGRQPLRTVNSIASSSQQCVRTHNIAVQPSLDDDIDVVCHCGESAVLLTVRKPGPNEGRKFYKCPKQPPDRCNFFLWSESRSTHSSNTNDNRFPSVTENDTVVMCRCPATAKRLIVQKEGQNKGRHFYVCSKSRENGCNFFQWAEEPSSQTSLNSFLQNNDKSSNSRVPEKVKKKRKCSICGQEGHNRRNCPQLE
ncbi:DNA topoisomerase 3-alpha-like [Centruroides sculpturatus]|uniref:DNA topoisomerase 3-alpha-like n=1 Tax=Centruroides sculpturatus TaxID=218467 RepID=UPI000C6CEDCA|nr:DNA topoisomerase 3-alpha-like [Centruroides sculpturatus]